MMARKDIDAVMLAVPDHWHALMSVEAANNNKDIFGEKPLARTIAELVAARRINGSGRPVPGSDRNGTSTTARRSCGTD